MIPVLISSEEIKIILLEHCLFVPFVLLPKFHFREDINLLIGFEIVREM